MTIEEFWQQEPPLLFRRVVEGWARAEQLEEAKKAARKAKQVARTAPKAATITDNPAVTKPVGGVWVCKICKDAPPKYQDYPNNHKWKTEKGFLDHVSSDRCFGVKPWA